jgi:hypothetical protein
MTIGGAIHLHMNNALEKDLVQGCLKILREAKSRKQKSGKQTLYQMPLELLAINENANTEEGEQNEEEKEDSDDDDFEDETYRMDMDNMKRSNFSSEI